MQTITEYLKKFHRTAIVFTAGKYEIQIFTEHARHNLLGVWTEIPLDSQIVINEELKYIQIASPNAATGDQVELVFEFCGSWMM